MAGLNSLYPPIIDTYMPAFVATSTSGACNIYFSLSKYNVPNDIKSVWVSVTNQYTNESVLTSNIGVKYFDSFSTDNAKLGDDKYFITLYNQDIKGGWVLNQLYKVQIRFCSQKVENPTMNWIVENSNLFSEWSTVCLIQGIARPELIIKNFEAASSGTETIFTTLNNSIVGQVYFEDDEELESYHFSIFNSENLETPIYESGVIYTNSFNPNEINHALKISLTDGEKYLMKFTYTTVSMYEETVDFSFLVIENGGEVLDARISAEQDEENGRIKVHITSDTNRFFGNLTIRRAASDTNFSIWKDVHTTAITSEDFLDFTWYDSTVESGIWYKYGVQKRNSLGDRGLIITTLNPVMVTLQDMFLTRADQQLKIKFNPQVGSFKKTLSESLTQTLGSKYPFIKRNANVGYRQFTISGLISHFCDENESFISETELYKNRKDLYDKYNEENRITEYNDFTLERTFREKVQEFLYANNVKLFRSPAEGNILVRLMDINFSPETTLGRMVYSFSATAYEIDEISFENFEKYGIQKVGSYSEQIIRSYDKTSQYSGTITGSLTTVLQDWETTTNDNGLKKTILYLNSLDLEFDSDPYLIDTTTNGEPVKLKKGELTDEGTVHGHIVKVNGVPIIIYAGRKLTISAEDNIKITSLEFPYETSVQLTYNCTIEEGEDVSSLIRQVYYTSKAGQLWGDYIASESIVDMINKKYTAYNNEWYQRVYAINSIKVEADPGTVFYIKDSSDNIYRRYYIGNTGVLNIEDKHYSIEDCYILGMNLSRKTDNTYVVPRDNEYVLYNMDVVYDTIKDIKSPIKNGVYLVKETLGVLTSLDNIDASENNYFSQLSKMLSPYKDTSDRNLGFTVIYYKNNWHLFTNKGDVILSTPALIDYYYEFEKGEY